MYWIYLLSIALQCAGAATLIISYWGKSVDEQLSILAEQRTVAVGTTLNLGDSVPSEYEAVKNIVINRIAFVYILLGYLICVLGNPRDKCSLLSIVLVLILSIVLMGIAKVISLFISKKYQKK